LNYSCSYLDVGLALSWLSEQISDLEMDGFVLTTDPTTTTPNDFFFISPGVDLF